MSEWMKTNFPEASLVTWTRSTHFICSCQPQQVMYISYITMNCVTCVCVCVYVYHQLFGLGWTIWNCHFCRSKMVGIKVVISHDSTYMHAIFNAGDRRADTSFFMWNLPNQWLNLRLLHRKHRVLTTGPPTKSQDQRLLSQTNVSVAPGSILYGKLQFPQVENGDDRRIQLLELLWGLLGQCMECTDQCWGKVTKEGLSELQQLLVLATPICLWNCSFLSYQGLGFFLKDAHCWSPAQGMLPNSSWSLTAQFPGCHCGVCLQTPRFLQGESRTSLQDCYDVIPNVSSPQAQQYHAAEEVPSETVPSGLFLNKDVWLLCNQCFSGCCVY